MSDGDEAVLHAADVGKSYGETTALNGVSLRVSRGEVFGLIGPNGAGKTTLVRGLTGTTRVRGDVRVFDTSPTAVDPHRIGLLPQEFAPPARLTPQELVEYYGGLYETARDTEDVLADVGLGDSADVRYEALSGGQKRRVCVATALVNEPDLLFLDEPTTGIDPAGRRALWELIDRLAAGGATVFLTSHSMTEVERLADRVGLLRAGRLVATGTPRELVREHGGRNRLVVGVDPEQAASEDGPVATAQDALKRAGFEARLGLEELIVEGVTPAEVGKAVDALEAAGVAYESLTWTEPSLEDVYLRLTGEAFEGSRTPGVTTAEEAPPNGTQADGETSGQDRDPEASRT